MPNSNRQANFDDDVCHDRFCCHSSKHCKSTAQIRLFITGEKTTRMKREFATRTTIPLGQPRLAGHRLATATFLTDCRWYDESSCRLFTSVSHKADKMMAQQRETREVAANGGASTLLKSAKSAATTSMVMINKQSKMRSRSATATATATSSRAVSKLNRPLYLLSVCLLAIYFVASGAKLQETGQTNLPTVIVRGFLNYRTTVDGTVLLFTPDAGTGSQQPILATSQQPTQVTESQQLPTNSPAAAAPPSRDIRQSQLLLVSTQLIGDASGLLVTPLDAPFMTSLGASARVEPTSVVVAPPDIGPTSQLAASPISQWQADSPFVGNGRGQPLSNEQFNSVSGNVWHPVQATPPLDRSLQLQTSSNIKEKPLNVVQESSTTEANQASSRDTPSVQADDILQPPLLTSSAPKSNEQSNGRTTGQPVSSEASSTPSSSPAPTTPQSSPSTPLGRLAGARPKRPSLGFNGQAIRNRANGSNNAPNVSQGSNTARFKDSSATTSSSTTGQKNASINGIRRPGLSSGGSIDTSVTTRPSLANINGEPVASAFQNRLANANLRLRNRFKHRNQHHLASNSSNVNERQPTANSSLAGPSVVSLVPLNEGGSNQLLGVATIEHPVTLVGAAIPPGQPDEHPPLSESAPNGPAVGSDEVLISAASLRSGSNRDEERQSHPLATITAPNEPEVTLEQVSPEQQAGLKALSRAGEQRPSRGSSDHQLLDVSQGAPRVLSGAIQQGQLSSGPLNLDSLFQSDQPISGGDNGNHQQASDHQASHQAKDQAASGAPSRPQVSFSLSKKSNHNDKLNGWLDHHHNRFIPRPAPNADHPPSGHLSHQLAASLGGSSPLSPSFSSNLPTTALINSDPIIKSTPVLASNDGQSSASDSMKPSVGLSLDELGIMGERQLALNGTINGNIDHNNDSTSTLQMQTITKTYSTIMTSAKTRLVPLQVKSSTAIYTITENYIITKLMTAYQTVPANGEFILAEPLSTRAPFELFNEPTASTTENNKIETPPAVHNNAIAAPSGPSSEQVLQEQPISLDPSPKSANDWLHDFSNSNDNDRALAQQQQQLAASLIEQQAREANSLAALGFPSGNEPLDQLASSLDPAALLADGTINIPDLNNPIVLAAAIQNPQLAAVILAAQQLQLKQRQNKQQGLSGSNNQHQIAAGAAQLQPSYSTSLSTTIKQSTYTVRDTMYTTRLVSFKDGRTVRTRTVSEPGSVIEQVLTTMATEVTPVTIAIRPTAPLGASLATATSLGGQQQQAPSSQSTINNALFAAQLASLLARRQQQLQPSLGGQQALASNQLPLIGNSATPQQLLAFQQLLQQQQRANQQTSGSGLQAKQFQPNLQQLLQSMQQQNANPNNNQNVMQQQQPSASSNQQDQLQNNRQQLAPSGTVSSATPALTLVPSAINLQPTINGPITTTLTSLQVRTYTVHNAFKTIYRTITSTQLQTSTIYPPGFQRSSSVPAAG